MWGRREEQTTTRFLPSAKRLKLVPLFKIQKVKEELGSQSNFDFKHDF